MRGWIGGVVACALALGAAGAHAQAAGAPTAGAPADGAPVRKAAWVWVELDDAGAVTAVTADEGENPLVAGVLESHARTLAFAPAERDGAAVASGVPLQLVVDFVPVGGGDYRPDLVHARVAPMRWLQNPPPRYPPQAAMNGTGGRFRFDLRIDAEGRVDPASLEPVESGFDRDRRARSRGDEAALLEATRTAIAGWRARVARIGDGGVTVRENLPVSFWPPGRTPDDGATDAAAPDTPAIVDAGVALPRLLKDFGDPPGPGAREPLRIEATRVRRGERP